MISFPRAVPVLLGSAVLVAATMAPAEANDESISFHGATARYLDATDQLCANAVDDYSTFEDYAIAYIENAAGDVVFSQSDSEGGGRTCTGNLSIPEDRVYYLRVADCSRIPGTDCGFSARKAFRS
ncbi:hypothetical protein GCM10009795_063360 [Nocardioides hankookensis]|uniref:Secreted protein n=1 Tax=Nocardioides hankookensis TaxID=443157 RepID=A0ABW1LNV2_9ACTN